MPKELELSKKDHTQWELLFLVSKNIVLPGLDGHPEEGSQFSWDTWSQGHSRVVASGSGLNAKACEAQDRSGGALLENKQTRLLAFVSVCQGTISALPRLERVRIEKGEQDASNRKDLHESKDDKEVSSGWWGVERPHCQGQACLGNESAAVRSEWRHPSCHAQGHTFPLWLL